MSIYQSTKVSPYVYQLTHKITGQFYIGYREANLIPSDRDLPIYKSSSDKIDELGFENFNYQILAEFFDGDSAYDFENRTIEVNIKNPLCLNGHFTKDGKMKFKRKGPHSQETKDKISLGHVGKIVSQETKDKISTLQLGKKRGKTSQETRDKIANALKGRKKSQESKDKMSLSLTGKIMSQDTRDKISKSLKGHTMSQETRDKIANTLKSYNE